MFSKKNFYIIVAVGAVAVIGGLVAYRMYKSYKTYTSYRTYTSDKSDMTDLQPSPAAARYVNKRYGFSFDKPEGYTVGVIAEGDGEMILVQSNRSDMSDTTDTTYKPYTSDTTYKPYTPDKSQSGFQIFINQLGQPIELTPDFIKKDLPGTAVNNPLAIVLDDKGKGIMFDSNSEAFGGQSFEIWFVYNEYIYQITSYASFGDELKKIIGSWKFN